MAGNYGCAISDIVDGSSNQILLSELHRFVGGRSAGRLGSGVFFVQYSERPAQRVQPEPEQHVRRTPSGWWRRN